MKKMTGMALVLGLAFAAQADVSIGLVGGAESQTGYNLIGTEVSSFYTTSVDKSLDVNGDDQYGTDGYLIFGGETVDNGGDWDNVNDADMYALSAPSFVDSFSIVDSATVIRNNASEVPMDDPDAAVNGDDFNYAGYLMNNTSSDTQTMLTFDVNTESTVTFRLGILAGNESNTNLDPDGLVLSFEDGTTASITDLETLSGLDPTTGIGMVFFDITLDAGTIGTFTVSAIEGAANPTIAGLTFDVIPEPATLGMLGLAGAALFFVRRRFRM
jgi:hypothetical protein